MELKEVLHQIIFLVQDMDQYLGLIMQIIFGYLEEMDLIVVKILVIIIYYLLFIIIVIIIF